MNNFSLADELNFLRTFQGSAVEFLKRFMAVRVYMAKADAGAVLSVLNGEVSVVALSASYGEDPPWLIKAKELAVQSLRSRKASCLSIGKNKGFLHIQPFPGGRRPSLMVLVGGGDMKIKDLNSGVMDVSYALLDNYESRMTLKKRQQAVARVYAALDLQLTVNKHKCFNGFAYEVCNELASRFHCTRVALGRVVDGHVRIRAISHMEKFSNKSKVVCDLEDAMEESLDQDREIVYPPVAGARYIYRQTEKFSSHYDQSAILSLPLHFDGEVVGVLLLERKKQKPFSLDEMEIQRLVCDLITPRLLDLEEKDSLFGSLPKLVKSPMKYLLGSRHTLAKAICLLFAALLFFLSTARGAYRLEGTFRLEVENEKRLSAPFEGILATVHCRKGDYVEKGMILAEMDTLDLKLKIAELRAQKLTQEKEYNIAVNERNMAKAQIAKARKKGLEAEIELAEENIRRGQLRAPISGQVFSEDLTRSFRAPVAKGDELFIIGDSSSLIGVAYIPEDQIADLENFTAGQIAVSGHAHHRLPVHVRGESTVAEVRDNRNVFRVEFDLKGKSHFLRPGMEGLLKIDAGERLYINIWTRRAVNWLRMYFWI